MRGLLVAGLVAAALFLLAGCRPLRASPPAAGRSSVPPPPAAIDVKDQGIAVPAYPFASLVPWGGHGLAYAYNNIVAMSPDGGAHWHTTTFSASTELLRLSFASRSTGYVFGYHVSPVASLPLVWVTHDAGQTWTSHTLAQANIPWLTSTLVFNAAGTLAVVTPSPGWTPSGGPAYLFNGQTFAPLPLPGDFEAFDGLFDGSALYVAGQEGTGGAVLASFDGGRRFMPVLRTAVPLTGLGLNGTAITAVGGVHQPKGLTPPLASEVLYQSSDGGHTWRLVYQATDQHAALSRIFWTPSGVGYALTGTTPEGANGQGYSALLMTLNGGRTWSRVLGSSAPTGGIASCVNRQEQVWCLDNGLLLASQDGSRQWVLDWGTAGAPVLSANLFGVDMASGVLTVNLGMGVYTLRKTTATGAWRLGPAPPVPWASPDFVTLETGYAVTGQTLLRSTDGGRHYHLVKLPGSPIAGSYGPSDFVSTRVGWMVEQAGPRNVLYRTSNGGGSWQDVAAVPALLGINFLNSRDGLIWSGNQWAATVDGGRRWHWHHAPSSDIVQAAAWNPDGSIWVVLAHPRVNAPSTAHILIQEADGQIVRDAFPASLEVSTLQFLSANTGYMVANGLLLRTTDAGADWTPAIIRPALTLSLPAHASWPQG